MSRVTRATAALQKATEHSVYMQNELHKLIQKVKYAEEQKQHASMKLAEKQMKLSEAKANANSDS